VRHASAQAFWFGWVILVALGSHSQSAQFYISKWMSDDKSIYALNESVTPPCPELLREIGCPSKASSNLGRQHQQTLDLFLNQQSL
jgi:hypothetical protein